MKTYSRPFFLFLGAYLAISPTSLQLAFGGCDLPTFGGARLFAAANQSEVPALGDFNDDGIIDAAVLNVSGSVSILLGNGDGTFKKGASYTFSGPFWVVTADFNGDGVLDLAVAASFQVMTMLGNGDGTFQNPIVTQASTSALAVGDFNGDGRPDLAISATPAAILLGNGDGTFQKQIAAAGPVTAASSQMAVGDFNRDGKLDVVVGGLSGGILVMLGDGSGNLSAPSSFSSATAFILSGITVGDVNGDHIPDVVTSNGLANSASVLLGVGDGTFQGPVTYSLGNLPTGAVIADFTGDGIPDLAVGSQTSFTAVGTISLLPGNGDGTFQPAISLNPTDQVNWALATADFNGDNVPDLLLVSTVANQPTQIGVMLGTPNGILQAPASYGTGSTPRVPVLADFNGDGKLDIAVANAGSNGNLSVFLNNGDGTYQQAVTYSTGFGAKSVAAGDVNGDGKQDLVVANGPSGNLLVFLGNGDGTFKTPVSAGSSIGGAWYLALGDVNNDGRPDVVIVGIAGVSILLGNGDGTFRAGSSISTFGCFGCAAGPATLADLNGDGNADLVLSNGDIESPAALAGAGTITVYLGKGDGSFQAGVNYTIGVHATAVAIGDLNGDGKPDMIVSDGGGSGFPPAPGALAVLLGNGDGTFLKAVRYASSGPLTYVTMGDFNGDGFPDVAAASNSGQSVTVFLSNGDGTLRNEILYGAGGAPTSVAVGDLNGDGKPDLLISDDIANSVVTLMNTYVVGATNSVCAGAPLAGN
ncbi:MAG TPA: VCBS repeat-containing protein [Bryobacteraceae bacterium]|jgi:hypothetical protein